MAARLTSSPNTQEGSMRRLVIAIVATFGLTAATSLGAAADISLTETTQVTLSCTDGHSVVLFADATTLTNLTSDVNAINASGTGTTCTLDTASLTPTTMSTSDWTVYDYNPGNGIHPRRSADSMPPTTADGGMTWQFNFRPDVFTALFTTTDPTVTGNDSMKTLTDTITVSGDANSFMTQRNGGDCVSNMPAVVRFYFASHSSSGSSSPPPGQPVMGNQPPAGFYTNFWWSNPIPTKLDLVNGKYESGSITADMKQPSEWSDWDGKNGATVAQAFIEAASNVQSIGLSFGGDCFFETGVTPTPDTFTNEVFSSRFGAS
jgi:hypothetical protein